LVDFVDWKSFIVGHVNSEATEQLDDDDCGNSREIVDFELRTAKFLGMPAVLIDLYPNATASRTSVRSSTEKLAALIEHHVHIINPVPMSHRPMGLWFKISLPSASGEGEEEADKKNEDAWLAWNELRRRFPVSRQLGVAIELPRDGTLPGDAVLERWMGEPLRCVVVHVGNFTNVYDGDGDWGGIYKLSERQETWLKSLFIGGCQVLLSTDGVDVTSEELQKMADAVKTIHVVRSFLQLRPRNMIL
jgi:hypothetical protein